MVLIRFENKKVKKVTKKVVSLLEKGGAVKTQCFNSSFLDFEFLFRR